MADNDIVVQTLQLPYKKDDTVTLVCQRQEGIEPKKFSLRLEGSLQAAMPCKCIHKLFTYNYL